MALFEEQSQYLAETFHARTTVVNLPKVTEIASRDLRRMLASEWTGGNVDPRPVSMDAGLWIYSAGKALRHPGGFAAPQRQHLRAISYSMVKAKRLPHIKGTEETAVALAKFWGVDPEKAPPGGDPSRLHQVLGPGDSGGGL